VSTIDARRSTSAQTQRLAELPTKHAARVAGVLMVHAFPLHSEPKYSPVKVIANVPLALHVVVASVARSPSLPILTIVVKALQRTALPVNFVFLGNANP